MKIWSKEGEDVTKVVEDFLSGENVIIEQDFVFYSVVGSIAHAMMLHKIGILNNSELKALLEGLLEIINLNKQRKFKLKKELEDVHTNIEYFLTEKCGEVGKKIHIGRSRNDQLVLEAALYMKEKLLDVSSLLIELCKTCETLASAYDNVPMPGYTHMRKAMLASFSHWISAYYEMFLVDLDYVLKTYDIIDKCALGAGASYGSILLLDREYTSRLMGFREPYVNTLAAIGCRGKVECLVLNVLSLIMQDLSRLADELILFSMEEFGYITIASDFCTGSSVMPQKKNPDVLEIIRAKACLVFALCSQAFMTTKAIPLGFNLDTHEVKLAMKKGFNETISTLNIFKDLLKTITVNEANMVKQCTMELYAADFATKLAEKGIPFREAYKIVGIAMKSQDPKAKLLKYFSKEELEDFLDPYKNIAMKTHLGAPGDQNLIKNLNAKKKKLVAEYKMRKDKFQVAINSLLKTAREISASLKTKEC